MTDVTFNRKAIDDLTLKLGECAKAQLEEPEWNLLLAIFAAAADKLVPSETKESGTLPGPQIDPDEKTDTTYAESDAEELREQLLHAYIPGKHPPGKLSSVTPIRTTNPPSPHKTSPEG
jgi:hypothetical protein